MYRIEGEVDRLFLLLTAAAVTAAEAAALAHAPGAEDAEGAAGEQPAGCVTVGRGE